MSNFLYLLVRILSHPTVWVPGIFFFLAPRGLAWRISTLLLLLIGLVLYISRHDIYFFITIFSLAAITIEIAILYLAIFLLRLVGIKGKIDKLWERILNTLPRLNAELWLRGISAADVALWSIIGALLAAHLFLRISKILEGIPFGFIVHALALFLSGCAIVLLVSGAKDTNIGPRTAGCGLAGAGVFACCTIASALFPAFVIMKADEIGKASDGYCLALSLPLREATAMENFTFLTMGKSRFGNHAILTVRESDGTMKHYHWSYWALAFLPGTYYGSVAHCRPTPHFGSKLPIFGWPFNG
ncbi:hypothetical protein [Breoghania sp. JC706]|uniref:hypothetical protein n=1 Tax=Breoghania sp. JC706 TaxID=3117732 RepID=UPI00300AC09C